jgi:hypothetical protein
MKVGALGVLAAVVVVAGGCGSNVMTGTGGNTGSGGQGGASGPCPAAEPSGGMACPGVPDGFRCTYGDEVRPECRHDWICSGGSWTTTKSLCVQSPNCGGVMIVDGDSCAGEDGSVCTSGDVICLCSACGAGPCMQNAAWTCANPPTGAGCPPAVPNDGSPCDAPSADCTYGLPCGGAGTHVTCKNGLWLWDQQIECPN